MTVTQGNLTQEEKQALAEEKGITLEELEAEIKAGGDTDLDDEEIKALLDKHQSDPKALAKALKASRQEVAQKVLDAKREREEREAERLRNRDASSKPDKTDALKKLKKKLKPVFNQETGEWETSDEALETLAGLSQRISGAMLQPVYERLASAEIRNQKAEIKSLPHFKDVEKDIDELLAKMSISERMKDGSVLAAYKYAIGDKAIRDADKKPTPKEDINVHRQGGGGGGSAPKKLSPDQLEEFDKNWKGKGFDEEDYLDLLNRRIEQDKAKGFKTKRTLIAQTVSS